MGKIKNVIIISTFLVILLLPIYSLAAPVNADNEVVFSEEVLCGNYLYETIIVRNDLNDLSDDRGMNQNATYTKTTYAKDSLGNNLWSVSITGSFYYNGSTVYCTGCSHQTAIYNNSWSIISSGSNYSGNAATATATAQKKFLGSIIDQQTLNVTLICNPDGTAY